MRCVLRPQPHATPVAVQNFLYLPCNLRGLIPSLASRKATKSLLKAMQQCKMHKNTRSVAMTISGSPVHPAASKLLRVTR